MARLPAPLQRLIQRQALLEEAARIHERAFGGRQSELQQDECTLCSRVLRCERTLQERQALPQQQLGPRDVTLEAPEIPLPGAQHCQDADGRFISWPSFELG